MRREIAVGSALGVLAVLAILGGLIAMTVWVAWVDHGYSGLELAERLLALAEWLMEHRPDVPPLVPLPTYWTVPALYIG